MDSGAITSAYSSNLAMFCMMRLTEMIFKARGLNPNI